MDRQGRSVARSVARAWRVATSPLYASYHTYATISIYLVFISLFHPSSTVHNLLSVLIPRCLHRLPVRAFSFCTICARCSYIQNGGRRRRRHARVARDMNVALTTWHSASLQRRITPPSYTAARARGAYVPWHAAAYKPRRASRA